MHNKTGRNEQASIVNFWRYIEFFTPNTLPKIAPSDAKRPIYNCRLNQSLPWEQCHAHYTQKCHPARPTNATQFPDKEWAYNVYACPIDVVVARNRIENLLGDSKDSAVRDQREPAGAAGFAFEVTPSGHAVSESAVLSVFAWAYARTCAIGAQAGQDSGWLDGFEKVEEEVLEHFEAVLAGQPVTATLLNTFSQWLEGILKLPIDLAGGQRAFCRVQCYTRKASEPLSNDAKNTPLSEQDAEPTEEKTDPAATQAKLAPSSNESGAEEKGEPVDVINSMYLDELKALSSAVSEGRFGPALNGYLGKHFEPAYRIDLRNDIQMAYMLLHPGNFPQGRWPGEGRHPLVFSQQLAINIAYQKLAPSSGKHHGIMAVNGPPGTGKTTLLKDLLACIIVERAKLLHEFNSPEDAFASKAVDAWKNGDNSQKYFPLDKRLEKFGVVVASSNNGAVENVSMDFPKADEVDQAWGANDSPFVDVASHLLGDKGPAWRMMSARLGRQSNRKDFVNKFWWPRLDPTLKPPEQKKKENMLPGVEKLLKAGSQVAPLSWQEARQRFALACREEAEVRAKREKMVKALEETENTLTKSCNVRAICRENVKHYTDSFTQAKAAVERADAPLRAAYEAERELRLLHVKERTQALRESLEGKSTLKKRQITKERELAELNETAPAVILQWLGKFIPIPSVECWKSEKASLRHDIKEMDSAVSNASEVIALTQASLNTANEQCTQQAILEDLKKEVDAVKAAKRIEREAMLTSQKADKALAESEQQYYLAKTALAAASSTFKAYRDKYGKKVGVSRPEITRDAAERELSSPWADDDWNEARVQVLLAALDLQDAFVLHAGKKAYLNMMTAIKLINGDAPAKGVTREVAQSAWAMFFLMVPLVSTTFASFHRQFQQLENEDIGWLLIDEAGQAAPQHAAGAIWRSQRVMVVGDPFQLEPVVTVPDQLQDRLRLHARVEEQWMPGATSTQECADNASQYGSYIKKKWVGAPLLVHRRCDSPMFDISNAVAYENAMVYGKPTGKSSMPASSWVHVPAINAQNHWIPGEGEAVLALIKQLRNGGLELSSIFLISPFTKVVAGLESLIQKHRLYGVQTGTIHKVQGKEAPAVILVLGGDPAKEGAKQWATSKPNLVNVAVSRAKSRLYIVGDHNRWKGYPYIKDCLDNMTVVNASSPRANTAILDG